MGYNEFTFEQVKPETKLSRKVVEALIFEYIHFKTFHILLFTST